MLLVLPLRKEDQHGVPFLTLVVCVACVLVFLFVDSETAMLALAFDPRHPQLITSLSSSFVHDGIFHLVGNLFFFYCFAGAIEKGITVKAYVLVFLLLSLGTDLAYAHVAKGTLPTVGISGVVSGFMGMFLVRHLRARIECLVWYLWVIRRIQVPGILFVLSFMAFDVAALRAGDDSEVNYAAHVFGFVLGAMLQLVLWRVMEQDEEPAGTSRDRLTRR